MTPVDHKKSLHLPYLHPPQMTTIVGLQEMKGYIYKEWLSSEYFLNEKQFCYEVYYAYLCVSYVIPTAPSSNRNHLLLLYPIKTGAKTGIQTHAHPRVCMQTTPT